MKNKKVELKNVLLYFVFLCFLFISIYLKINYHIDELFSYNLSNHNGTSAFIFEDGIKYEDFNDRFLEYSTTSKETQFNIVNVWNNQKADVHPPLYYILFNFVSSLFVGEFSKWFPGIINIILSLITFYYIRKILNILTNNKLIVFFTSLTYICCTGIIDDTAFFRMYVMAMLWVTVITYLFLRTTKNNDKINHYLIAFFALLGALTHYYCIIYAFFISLIYVVTLILEKQNNKLIHFCVCMIIAGVCALAIFPSMINHMFSGYRGAEATSNFFNLDDYITRFIIFFKIINNEIFADLLIYLLSIIILLFIIISIKNKRLMINKQYLLIFIPSILYFLLVSKIAAYKNERYISLIYPVLFAGFICYLFELISKLFTTKNKIIIPIVGIVYVVNGIYSAKWTYLYRETKNLIDASIKYKDKECICVHGDANYDILHNSMELRNYRSVTFYNEETIASIENKEEDGFILKLIKVNDSTHCLNEIKKQFPQFSHYELLGDSREITYYIY